MKNNKRPLKGKSLTVFPDSYVVVDLETTGCSPCFDDIIELGAIKVKNNKIIDSFQQLINPGYEICEYVTDLTGITNKMLATAPDIDKVIDNFMQFISDNIIVGHNVHFDINFLYDAMVSLRDEPLTNDFVDTLKYARKLCKDLQHHRLIDLIDYFNIEIEEQHRALSDCESTYFLYSKLKECAVNQFENLDDFSNSFHKNSYNYRRQNIIPTTTEFDITHPLFNKRCVITGKLQEMTRCEAEQIIVNLGGIVEKSSVTKHTNFLIMGNNDYCKTIKDGKSNKQKRAEKYILQGCDLKIIPEDVFYDLIYTNEKDN